MKPFRIVTIVNKILLNVITTSLLINCCLSSFFFHLLYFLLYLTSGQSSRVVRRFFGRVRCGFQWHRADNGWGDFHFDQRDQGRREVKGGGVWLHRVLPHHGWRHRTVGYHFYWNPKSKQTAQQYFIVHQFSLTPLN